MKAKRQLGLILGEMDTVPPINSYPINFLAVKRALGTPVHCINTTDIVDTKLTRRAALVSPLEVLPLSV